MIAHIRRAGILSSQHLRSLCLQRIAVGREFLFVSVLILIFFRRSATFFVGASIVTLQANLGAMCARMSAVTLGSKLVALIASSADSLPYIAPTALTLFVRRINF